MTTTGKSRRRRKQGADRCIAAEPADPQRAEQLRAMVTTPERYHDERVGGQDDPVRSPSTVTAERLLAAERLAAAERLYEAAESAEPGPDAHQAERPLADPSTFYDDSMDD